MITNNDPLRPSMLKISNFLKQDHHGQLPAETLDLMSNYSIPTPSVLPDHRKAVIDFTYWFAEQPERWDVLTEYRNGQGAWNRIGKHLHFQPGLRLLAEDLLRHTFDLGPKKAIPPVRVS